MDPRFPTLVSPLSCSRACTNFLTSLSSGFPEKGADGGIYLEALTQVSIIPRAEQLASCVRGGPLPWMWGSNCQIVVMLSTAELMTEQLKTGVGLLPHRWKDTFEWPEGMECI